MRRASARIQQTRTCTRQVLERIREAPARVSETPARIPETPIRFPETSIRIPETPTRIPETPTRIVESPARLLETSARSCDARIVIRETLKRRSSHPRRRAGERIMTADLHVRRYPN
jgi:hypothetical protein